MTKKTTSKKRPSAKKATAKKTTAKKGAKKRTTSTNSRTGRKPWRRDLKILARLDKVSALLGKGFRDFEVAEMVGVSKATLSADKQKLAEIRHEQIAETERFALSECISFQEDMKRLALRAYEHDRRCEMAVLYGKPYPERDEVTGEVEELTIRVWGEKGSAQFRGSKVQAIQAASSAGMNVAKLKGLVVDHKQLTGKDGKDLVPLEALRAMLDEDDAGELD